MRLTKSKKDWVLNKVKHYSKLLQVTPPDVIFTMADYNRKKIEMRKETGHIRVGRSNSHLLGVCHNIDEFIVILIKKLPNTKRLDETIRHELIHYTKSYNHKSKQFYNAMQSLKQGKVKNGRFYK